MRFSGTRHPDREVPRWCQFRTVRAHPAPPTPAKLRHGVAGRQDLCAGNVPGFDGDTEAGSRPTCREVEGGSVGARFDGAGCDRAVPARRGGVVRVGLSPRRPPAGGARARVDREGPPHAGCLYEWRGSGGRCRRGAGARRSGGVEHRPRRPGGGGHRRPTAGGRRRPRSRQRVAVVAGNGRVERPRRDLVLSDRPTGCRCDARLRQPMRDVPVQGDGQRRREGGDTRVQRARFAPRVDPAATRSRPSTSRPTATWSMRLW